jgi:hypothetical protein
VKSQEAIAIAMTEFISRIGKERLIRSFPIGKTLRIYGVCRPHEQSAKVIQQKPLPNLQLHDLVEYSLLFALRNSLCCSCASCWSTPGHRPNICILIIDRNNLVLGAGLVELAIAVGVGLHRQQITRKQERRNLPCLSRPSRP